MSYTPEEICDHLEEIIVASKVSLPEGHARGLAAAIIEGTGRRGIAIVDEDDVLGSADEMLSTLKSIRRRVQSAVDDDETPARDLASLARRLQDVAREIHSLEERQRADATSAKGSRKTNGSSRDTKRPAARGQVSI